MDIDTAPGSQVLQQPHFREQVQKAPGTVILC